MVHPKKNSSFALLPFSHQSRCDFAYIHEFFSILSYQLPIPFLPLLVMRRLLRQSFYLLLFAVTFPMSVFVDKFKENYEN